MIPKAKLRAGIGFACLGVVVIANGCATGRAFIPFDTARVKPLASTRFSAHGEQVLLIDGPWPAEPATEVIVIARIEVGTANDHPNEHAFKLIADRCRAAGGHAVVELNIWRQPRGFSWAAPHCSGVAIRVQDTNVLRTLRGYWY